MSRISAQNLPANAALPAYDRAAKRIGIVHFGLGAFTRAHQAWYTDRAMEAFGGDWLIAGISLRSPTVGEQLNPQDGLYTLAEKSGEGTKLRVIGSVAEVIVAPENPARIKALLCAPTTHIVTFTVTEKGYCRKADGGLDLALAAQGFYPLLADAFAARKAAGIGGLTLLSCDNLADNGHQLKRLMGEYLAAYLPDLVDWVGAHCTFPCSMVDRIVPATTDADRAEVEGLLGLRDEGVVMTEPFSQWVIEDNFAGPRPAWDAVGAQIVGDVAPYETAKLRMLNGAHSALAYCGLAGGYTYVHQAVGDPVLRAMALRLMREEAAPTIPAPEGMDLAAYADALIERFDNPALNHRLIQIAMDGSQKIPQRWLATLAAHQAQGRSCPAILGAIAAWIKHLRGQNGPVDDPRATELTQAAKNTDPVHALFGAEGGMASPWLPTDQDAAAIRSALSL
ncbi:mannitol dehydrogenase family protein [Novosphingobium humi]|uniref:Mannitol dehydrogenase family protein n=1 Tax=Novosphingobium humi TaxID=2282397 RepID=A0ABY7U1U3_9SPHN|nr:mannitol dehydrogenase family protein [Novosphingobium humi]WCT78837.1 mannitol dehydrogenase family protein [Novosphingobium humi]